MIDDSIGNNLWVRGDGKVALQESMEALGNISIAISDEVYITRSIKETQEEIEKREEEIFILEKKLLTLNGLKRQMDKKNGLHFTNTSSTIGPK